MAQHCFDISSCRCLWISILSPSVSATRFSWLYQLEGRKLVFGNGRLLIDGVDAGQFQYFKGDATKGPDTIALSVEGEITGPTDIDQRRMLRIAAGGLEVPLDAGGYAMAVPC